MIGLERIVAALLPPGQLHLISGSNLHDIKLEVIKERRHLPDRLDNALVAFALLIVAITQGTQERRNVPAVVAQLLAVLDNLRTPHRSRGARVVEMVDGPSRNGVIDVITDARSPRIKRRTLILFVLQAAFKQTRAIASPAAIFEFTFLGDRKLLICRWRQRKVIGILSEDKSDINSRRFLQTIERKRIRATGLNDKLLKALQGHCVNHAENLNEITLASAIGTDDDIQIAKVKIHQIPDGLKPSNRNLIDFPRHDP